MRPPNGSSTGAASTSRRRHMPADCSGGPFMPPPQPTRTTITLNTHQPPAATLRQNMKTQILSRPPTWRVACARACLQRHTSPTICTHAAQCFNIPRLYSFIQVVPASSFAATRCARSKSAAAADPRTTTPPPPPPATISAETRKRRQQVCGGREEGKEGRSQIGWLERFRSD